MIDAEVRARILQTPESVLEDRDLMRALVAASDRALGDNVVDLRGIAMDRLEARLDRLEDTHQTVIAAAYENLSGTQAVHRAVLAVLEATTFAAFLGRLGDDVPRCLRVDRLHLVLETAAGDEESRALSSAFPQLDFVAPGTVEAELAALGARPDQMVKLGLGEDGSRALIRLDLGPGRLPALLRLDADDPSQFQPGQATDLLAFFGGAVERVLRRWLA